MHGDETVGRQLIIYFAEYLLQNMQVIMWTHYSQKWLVTLDDNKINDKIGIHFVHLNLRIITENN